ncbi:MAG: hypothetical protein IJ165_11185 [Proteobacteria bacterium]|nr:hypothetical protein [Pseudomonadota bacterium]
MKHKFIFSTSLILASLTACTLDPINNYGNDCTNWAYIRNGSSISCDSKTLEDCNEAFQAAYKAGKCPEHYGMCTFDNDGNKFCMASCSSASAPNLCNGECLTDAEYALARKEKKREAAFCTPCPIDCKDSCNPKTLKCPQIDCLEDCADGCDDDGFCKCSIKCTNGCDATGTTCCMDTCQNGCNENGMCLCPKDDNGKSCASGCDVSGRACCDLKCKNGCNIDGTCLCPLSCKHGCNDNGECQPNPIGCTHGFNQNNGDCLCADTCTNGCDEKGETCNCPNACPKSCDPTGTECLCQPSCADGSSCDSKTGRCTCIPTCSNGCKDDGTCDEACKTIQCQGENEQCQNGACVDLCKSTIWITST